MFRLTSDICLIDSSQIGNFYSVVSFDSMYLLICLLSVLLQRSVCVTHWFPCIPDYGWDGREKNSRVCLWTAESRKKAESFLGGINIVRKESDPQLADILCHWPLPLPNLWGEIKTHLQVVGDVNFFKIQVTMITKEVLMILIYVW